MNSLASHLVPFLPSALSDESDAFFCNTQKKLPEFKPCASLRGLQFQKFLHIYSSQKSLILFGAAAQAMFNTTSPK